LKENSRQEGQWEIFKPDIIDIDVNIDVNIGIASITDFSEMRRTLVRRDSGKY